MRFRKINEHSFRRLSRIEELAEDIKEKPLRGLCFVAVVALTVIGIVSALN